MVAMITSASSVPRCDAHYAHPVGKRRALSMWCEYAHWLLSQLEHRGLNGVMNKVASQQTDRNSNATRNARIIKFHGF
jgi:hypothetical protein